jgi:exoribonuclease R
VATVLTVPRPKLRLRPAAAEGLGAELAAIRTELGVPDAFTPEVLAEAEAAARAPRLPDLDLTSVEFATLDPLGSTDLDQAYVIERASTGYRVRYAIADVAAFVTPGGAVDAEAHRRVETLYAPDGRIPLHPPVLSEGAASLLPGQDRPALVWTLDLDATGELTATDVRRAVVRSREQQEYVGVQRALDDGTAAEPLALLREVGRLRQQLERARGGMSLNTPEQEVVPDPDGGWELAFRAALPVEDWNAQISLLTGMAAAKLMLAGGVGVLRTMPPADPRDVDRLRRVARGLGIEWPHGVTYGELLSGLTAARGRDAAFLTEATRLFRGAAYTAFDGAPPAETTHAAIASAYAHCTAPLRRLVDRYVGEVCVSLCAGGGAEALPPWARAALPQLPAEMAAGIHRGNQVDRADLDLVEAAVLAPAVGQLFSAVVVDLDERRGGATVQVAEPAVLAHCDAPKGQLPLGGRIDVRLVKADVATRTVRFVREPAAR